MDLLKDPHYLAKNAAITAECALKVAAPYLKTTFSESPTLILGWGRIGKCLARLLSARNCPVSVAARKESDRAMLEAFGSMVRGEIENPFGCDYELELFRTLKKCCQ
jgi:dipicolinate synthase subunit A